MFGKDGENMSYASGGQVSPLENSLLKPKRSNISCEPAITLLNIYSTEMHTFKHQDPHTRMFIGAMFIIAKKLKQPKYPSTW